MANPYIKQGAMVAPEESQIARQQKLAEMLQMQAAQPIETNQVVSGRVVPVSWAQGLAKALQGWQAGRASDKADEMSRAYSQAQKQNRLDTLQALQADPSKAAEILMGSQDPTLQNAGLQEALKRAQGNADKFGKVNPHDYTPESIKAFSASGDFGVLVPVRKQEVAPSGVVFNPYEVKPGTVFNDPNKLVSIGQNGQAVINQTALDAKSRVARAGAANVSVNTAQKPFLTEIGKGVGEAVNNAYAGAQSAVQTLNNVQQINAAIDKAVVGPGSNVRLGLDRIGETLGIAGQNAQERLANTRAVIQGLARQELAAAGSMKGQGQITESERDILRRAEAGQINELSRTELKTLTNALTKTAQYRIQLHQQNLERLKQDPNAAGIVNYMTVNAPGAPEQPAANRNVTVDY